MKNFTSVHDAGNIDALVAKALAFKKDPFQSEQIGKNKKAGLVFLNPSLRTRISTQVAAKNLGMETIVFNADKEGWALEFAEDVIMNGATVEHIKDAAPVLGAYFDVLCIRVFPGLKDRDEDYSEFVLNQFIKYAGIPVVSLESATLHPLQSFADAITITENMPARRPKVVLSWAPHIKPLPQCVANSFSQWMDAWDKVDLVIAHPEGYELSETFTAGAVITNDQEEALQGADFVYVKNWSSFFDYGSMPGRHTHWMLTLEKLKQARVMHCLPVRRNLELSAEVLDSNQSLVVEQAANRIWAAQTVLAEILANN